MNGLGPTPGSINIPGMGGPGSGMIGPGPGAGLMPSGQPSLEDFLRWLEFAGAGGFGMGPYGYPLAYGLSVPGQQNLMLNEQWGLGGIGSHRYPR